MFTWRRRNTSASPQSRPWPVAALHLHTIVAGRESLSPPILDGKSPQNFKGNLRKSRPARIVGTNGIPFVSDPQNHLVSKASQGISSKQYPPRVRELSCVQFVNPSAN